MATKRGSIKQNKWTVSQEHLENFTVSRQGTKNSTSLLTSLTKQTTFRDATGGFPAKWRLRNERRNSRHYTDLGNASDWLMQISQTARPIRSTTQIWVVTRHQYGISALISQTLFRGKTTDGVAKFRLFSQDNCSPISMYLESNGVPMALQSTRTCWKTR